MKKILFFLSILFINQAIAVEFDGKFIQGHFIIGKTDPNTNITIDKKKVKVSKDGYFAFGIGKDRKFDIVITEGDKKIIKKVKFSHPFYDLETIKSQKHLMELQGTNNTWFCGSYFGYGFHEDGLKSTLNIVDKI